MKRYLSIRQTADLLNVSPRTIYRWMKCGHLEVIKIGQTVRIDIQDIEKKKGILEDHDFDD